jgi:hypothetical protein
MKTSIPIVVALSLALTLTAHAANVASGVAAFVGGR